MNKKIIYPYIPNSVEEIKAEMLREVGASNLMDLYEEIPKHLLLGRRLDISEPILDEFSLKQHISSLLQKNMNANETINFLGAGCYQHFVPAVCDEINGRGEFLTAYGGDPYADHGRIQALFEYSSMMAELLDMDVVGAPVYDGPNAFAKAVCMAARITGRSEVLIAGSLYPDAVRVVKNYIRGVSTPTLISKSINFDAESGLIDLSDLKKKLCEDTAAVCIQNPNYLGILETQVFEIGRLAREAGAEFIVYVDPISLGVIDPPASYGATLVCGDFQPLGMHMQYGGGHGGFIASNEDIKHLSEYADIMYGITETIEPGEFGFGNVQFEKSSYGAREKANEFTGTGTVLWAITAGVYLALMGPNGIHELGKTIVQKSHYAASQLGKLKGVKSRLSGPFFKEFVVNFDEANLTVKKLNKALLDRKIIGGKDLSEEFPELGQSALFCVTEVKTQTQIDHLVNSIKEILIVR